MCRVILLTLAILLTTVSSNAEENIQWQILRFSKTTPDDVVMLFGPPSIIKTEERYSDWVINQAQGCGQIHTYAMSYSAVTGDLNILQGPLGKASEVDVIIVKGKVCTVVWTYDNNQREDAFKKWMSHNGLTKLGGHKPAVSMVGTWEPKKGTFVYAECYTGGEGVICRGPIKVSYSECIEQ